jgi:hypothetical protein
MKLNLKERLKRIAKSVVSKANSGLTAVYTKYPWLGSFSGKKRLTAMYGGLLGLGLQYAPQLSPWLAPAQKYGTPVISGVSLIMALWGLTHARVKKLEKREIESNVSEPKPYQPKENKP